MLIWSRNQQDGQVNYIFQPVGRSCWCMEHLHAHSLLCSHPSEPRDLPPCQSIHSLDLSANVKCLNLFPVSLANVTVNSFCSQEGHGFLSSRTGVIQTWQKCSPQQLVRWGSLATCLHRAHFSSSETGWINSQV